MPPKRKSAAVDGPAAKKGSYIGPVPDTKYKIEELVFCKYGNTHYEAKILEIDPNQGYMIHYQGWNKRYDGFVPFDEVPNRFLDHTPENVSMLKANSSKGKSKAAKTPSKTPNKPKATPKSSARDSTLESDVETKKEPEVKKETPVSTPKIKLATRSDKKKPEAPKQLKEEPNESKETTKVEEKKKVSSSPKKNELPKIDLYDKIVSDDLANILVEESEMITRKYKLATIPAKKTVYDAIHAFCSKNDLALPEYGKMFHYEKTKNFVEPSSVSKVDCCAAILNLFDISVSQILIYPFEGEHLESFICKETEENADGELLRLSKYLGITFLFRMLTRLHHIFAKSDVSEDRAKIILDCCNEVAQFLAENLKEYYDFETYYHQPASDYIRRNTKQT